MLEGRTIGLEEDGQEHRKEYWRGEFGRREFGSNGGKNIERMECWKEGRLDWRKMGRNIGRNIGGGNLAGRNLGAMVERILKGWNVGRKDDWIGGRWEGI